VQGRTQSWFRGRLEEKVRKLQRQGESKRQATVVRRQDTATGGEDAANMRGLRGVSALLSASSISSGSRRWTKHERADGSTISRWCALGPAIHTNVVGVATPMDSDKSDPFAHRNSFADKVVS